MAHQRGVLPVANCLDILPWTEHEQILTFPLQFSNKIVVAIIINLIIFKGNTQSNTLYNKHLETVGLLIVIVGKVFHVAFTVCEFSFKSMVGVLKEIGLISTLTWISEAHPFAKRELDFCLNRAVLNCAVFGALSPPHCPPLASRAVEFVLITQCCLPHSKS